MASTTPVPNGKPWQDVAAELQAHRAATLAAVQPALPSLPSPLPLNPSTLPSQLLTATELHITDSLPETLLSALSTGALTSTAVTTAFLRRAALAQAATNCLTELLPSRALARAAALDAHLAQTGQPVGPLHGLPISVKEHMSMEGLPTNAGFAAWAGHAGTPQAVILDILWSAGAVFYARTTQPQTLMHLETSSNLFGVTVNPFNTRKGQEAIVPVIGPLSTSLEGVKVFTKTLIDAKPWLKQVDLIPMKWRYDEEWLPKDAEGKKKLKVGVMWDDGVVKPHPPVLRAMKEVVDKLKAAGDVEVVEWTPYKHDLAWEIIASLYFADAGREEAAAIDASGEPWRPLSNFIIKENPHVPKEPYTIPEFWRLVNMRNQYRGDYLQHWNATATGEDGAGAVDVILCPVGPGAAPPIDNAKYWGYTSQWNLLDYPSLSFPVSQVDPAIDVKDETYQPRNEHDDFNHKLYEPETYRDAPVSLQLVGRRFEDEKLLQAMEYIVEKTGLPFAGYGVKKA
ncbi:putative acetamidase protein [Neofusicoccum parvum UCRNP2]|uniref:Putative acetamidase protein n=1 Tax=Botryosphaeria parva (strain UCR-NP2) TaxID=1287680 RepID=R1GQY0_BOTPV|nr:putative acetamidase protein [Neofusicoccum parvum UCRNP2]